MQHVARVEATCTTNGNVEYYHCSSCNKNYQDENGSVEIKNVILLAGHKIKDGACTICKKTASEGVKYTELFGRIYSVSKGTFNGTELIISDIYNGKAVTHIKEYGFSSCSGLTSITIPDSVTSIGEGAFSGCSSLTNIIIPDSVTSIGGGAFSGCTSLTSVTIPDGITSIKNDTFSGCTSLTNIIIPDSITSIGGGA
ncbi:MAG TPA: hypothetical protein DDY82_02870, partial [Clostridiales bacterium]|nr:hypothetical protein [Clostridiales bacterium]